MQNTPVTKENYKAVTRGQIIRMATPAGGYVTITRKELLAFLELYCNEYEVILEMHIRKCCYLTTVVNNLYDSEPALPKLDARQAELPF